MKKKAAGAVIGLILSSVNFTLCAADIMTYSLINSLKSFKLDMPLESVESAPPLTKLFVSSIYSTSIPDGELISLGQIETKKRHQGPVLHVNTVEIGIAQTLIAHMNGNELPISSMIRVKPLCMYKAGQVDFCKNYGTRIGYWRTWDVSKFGAGSFVYQATSIEYPRNTEHTKIHIQ